MKRIAIFFIIGWLFFGCTGLKIKPVVTQERYYSKIERMVVDFSKKIKAYYENQHKSIPKDFNGDTYIELLENIYPDKSKVEMVERSFKIKARAIDDNFSVMLCGPSTGSKVMEDLSCYLDHVEIRCWDKKDHIPCKFDDNWETYCK